MSEKYDPREWTDEAVERKLKALGKEACPTSEKSTLLINGEFRAPDRVHSVSFEAHYERHASEPKIEDGVYKEHESAFCESHSIWDGTGGATHGPALQDAQQLLAAACSYIIDAKDARLMADQIAFASGIYLRQGVSLTELAKKHGISKQAFSKGVVKVQERLGLKPSRGMKHNKELYGKRNHRNNKTK